MIQGFGSTDPKKQKILDFVRKRIDEDSKLKSADFAGKLGITLFFGKDTFKKEYRENFTEEGIIELLNSIKNKSR